MHHVGEEHRYLLVLRRLGGVCDWRAAVTTELGTRAQRRAAGPTGEARRCQCTATVATVVHVSIVSLLVSDVRHIAVRSPTRSFEFRGPSGRPRMRENRVRSLAEVGVSWRRRNDLADPIPWVASLGRLECGLLRRVNPK